MKHKNLNYLYILLILVIVFIIFIGITMTIKESYYTFKYAKYDPSFKSNQILYNDRSDVYKNWQTKLYDNPIMYQPNKDYPGNDIGQPLTGINYNTCFFKCIDIWNCEGIVTDFNGNNSGTCYLKSKMTTSSNSSNKHSTRIAHN